nr:hypothetical protein [Saccharothrix sp. ST-888]
MRAAARSRFTGVANLGSGAPVSMKQAIAAVEQVIGSVALLRRPGGNGDARHTAADIALDEREFGFRPGTELYEGLTAMAADPGR